MLPGSIRRLLHVMPVVSYCQFTAQVENFPKPRSPQPREKRKAETRFAPIGRCYTRYMNAAFDPSNEQASSTCVGRVVATLAGRVLVVFLGRVEIRVRLGVGTRQALTFFSTGSVRQQLLKKIVWSDIPQLRT